MVRKSLYLTWLLCSLCQAGFFEFGVASPMQILTPDSDVTGIRIGMFYTENKDIVGFDYNFVVGKSKGSVYGVSMSAVNLVERTFQGVQMGLVNWNGEGGTAFQFALANLGGGEAAGFRFALLNSGKGMTGAEIGMVNLHENFGGGEFGIANIGKKVRGVQIGIINYAEELHGLQLGLINIALNNSALPVFPLFNMNFN